MGGSRRSLVAPILNPSGFGNPNVFAYRVLKLNQDLYDSFFLMTVCKCSTITALLFCLTCMYCSANFFSLQISCCFYATCTFCVNFLTCVYCSTLTILGQMLCCKNTTNWRGASRIELYAIANTIGFQDRARPSLVNSPCILKCSSNLSSRSMGLHHAMGSSAANYSSATL